jgi:hypothetical protein
MHEDEAARVRILATEYIELVDIMRSGQYDGDEYRHLSSQRTLTHDELIRLTGLTDRKAMYGYCRSLLAGEAELPAEGKSRTHIIGGWFVQEAQEPDADTPA